MTDSYCVHPVREAAQWDALMSIVESPHLTQSWAYGEAKEAAQMRRIVFDVGGWCPRRFVIARGDDPVPICQLLEKRLAGVTVATRLNRGPLFLDAEPAEDAVRGVYGLLRGHALRCRRPLVLAPALPDTPKAYELLHDLGYRPRHVHGWASDRVDLRPDEEEMYGGLHRNWCWALRRACKAGVEFRVCESDDDFEWLLERHVEHMAEKQFVGMSPDFLRALRACAPRDDFMVTQVRLAGERVGGMVTYRFGDVAEGLILWVGQEGRCVQACRFLDWQTALELKRRGCRWFDLGGKRAGATQQFKAGMGGVEYRLLNEWATI